MGAELGAALIQDKYGQTKPVRAGLYARVSLNDDRQDPQTQLELLREYASSRGWEIAGEYVDRAGAVDRWRRSAWRRLRVDVQAKRVNLVLVWKLDRPFRSTLHALGTLREFNEQGVAFVSATQPIDTSTSSGRLLFTVLSAVGEIERDLISERTKAGMARAIARGKKMGRPKGIKERHTRQRRSKAEQARARELGLLD